MARLRFLYLASFSTMLCFGIAIALRFPPPVQAQSHPATPVTSESLESLALVGFKSPPAQGEPRQSGTTGTRGQCFQSKDQPPFLTPLTPGTMQGLTAINKQNVTEHPTLTVTGHPTIFVYVPQTSTQMAEFVLSEQTEEVSQEYTGGRKLREIYHTTLTLPGTPGIISIQVPTEHPPLEIGKVYQWSLSIICNPEDRAVDSSVLGWVKRTEPSPTMVKAFKDATPIERADLYGEYGIWHDLLTSLAELRRSQSEVATTWENLLKSESVNLDTLTQAPLLECCTPNN